MPQTIYDISPEVSEKIAVFPGDQKFQRHVAMDMKDGDHLTLSSVQTTVHVGAHADAPGHYHKEGGGISERDLSHYLGLCQVVHVEASDGIRIRDTDLKGMALEAPRVLFRTGSYPDPNQWKNDFQALSPELIHHLADQNVKTVGIDTPSIDPADAKLLESHQAVFERDLAILEGLVLKMVPQGLYQLVALPLALKDVDASPVRAVLLDRHFDLNRA